MYNRHPWSLKKSKSWGPFWSCLLNSTAILPIWPIIFVDRLNWQCCLAGSSKTAHRILIFSMAMGADYSYELIYNETCAPQFNRHNNSFLASVIIIKIQKFSKIFIYLFYRNQTNVESAVVHYQGIISSPDFQVRLWTYLRPLTTTENPSSM